MSFDLEKTVEELRRELKDSCRKRDFFAMQVRNQHLALSSLVRGMRDEKRRNEVLREIEAARQKPAGLTEAVSDILRQTHQSLSAKEVSYWLQREGFDLSDYSQPLATISIVLRRLANTARAESTYNNRRVTYRWIGER